ncbi:MAG TPA: hypothetical protein VKY65_17420 [Alphaproteobacteria bacterium]|nr:hypothetical protein [Alphaproteobacteria bacterium]
MNNTLLLAGALATAMTTVAWADGGHDPSAGERCYVAAKDLVTCGADIATCAQSASTGVPSNPALSDQGGKDANGLAWVYVPAGSCVKVYGGSLTPPKAPPKS